MKFEKGLLITNTDWVAEPGSERVWNIKRKSLQEKFVIQLAREEGKYRGGLFLTEMMNTNQGEHRLHREDFATLMLMILKLMRKERKNKLFMYAHNPTVSSLLDQFGAATDSTDLDFDAPLRILTYTQLESLSQTLKQNIGQTGKQ